MEDFKKLPKMQCFKTGGSVMSKPKAMCYGGKMKKGGEVDAADIKQDKAIVKKAIRMHDEQEHKGEHTDLSKLKKGGRTKKAVGTVKKFKTGGSVTNVYEAKKSSGDKDNIRKTKLIKPAKADAPSRASVKGKDFGAKTVGPSGHQDPYIKSKQSGKKAAAPSGAGGPDKFADGGSVLLQPTGKPAGYVSDKKGGSIKKKKKYAEGGSIDDDVRTRAMKWIESGSPEPKAEAPSAPVAKKSVAKSQPESDREENSPWMRELRKKEAADEENKRESASLAARYPEKRAPGKMIRDEAEIAQRPALEAKGSRLMKMLGLKRGGKACG
jgi:hypothetical protein